MSAAQCARMPIDIDCENKLAEGTALYCPACNNTLALHRVAPRAFTRHAPKDRAVHETGTARVIGIKDTAHQFTRRE